MTFADALAELGIEPDASPEQARRAYLRLLKTRKPETDPEGFMRLREAFERVKDLLAAREIGRRRLDPAPSEPAPLPQLVETLPSAGAAAEALPVVEAPSAPDALEPSRGAEGHEEEPGDDASDEEGEKDEEDEEPPSQAEVARLLGEGEREEAAYELGRLFAAALENLGGPPPPFYLTTRILLELHEHGEIRAAAALEKSAVGWLDASGQEVRVLRGNGVILWAMIRELGALKKKFPASARAAIARGIRTGDLAAARSALAALQGRSPTVAQDAGERLRVRAPVLAQQFADVLDPPPPPPRRAERASRGSGWGGYGALLFVALNVVRMLSTSSSPSPSPSTYETRAPMVVRAEAISDARREGNRQAVLYRAGRVSSHAHHAMQGVGASPLLDYGRMEAGAGAIIEAVSAHDCVRAREAMRGLEAMETGGDEIARAEIATLIEVFTECCPP